jgi:hypothetical protein
VQQKFIYIGEACVMKCNKLPLLNMYTISGTAMFLHIFKCRNEEFCHSSTLRIDATLSSETSVDFQRTTPRDRRPHNHSCKNLTSLN